MAELSEEKNSISAEIESRQSSIWKISDALWSYAELGLEEHLSSKLLADTLAAEGFNVNRGVAGMPTAFVATWENGNGGPVIGFFGRVRCLADDFPKGGVPQERSSCCRSTGSWLWA